GGHAHCDVVRGVALVPRQPVGDLELVVAGRHRGARPGPRAVPVGVLQPRAHAVRLPVARAAELGLVAARSGEDRALGVTGDPVGGVVVVEGDLPAGCGVGDVCAVARGTLAIVLVPALVDRRLVGVVTGRHVVGALPDLVIGVQRQLRLLAVGLPVTWAAHLGVVRPGRGHEVRLRDGADRARGLALAATGLLTDPTPG